MPMIGCESSMKKTERNSIKFYKNHDFINSPDARPIRILSEYIGPRRKFWEEGVRDTIVFFGSARTLLIKEANKELKALRQKAKKDSSVKMKHAIEAAEGKVAMAKYHEDAIQLSKRLTEWSMKVNKGKQRYLICSGGGPGIMEAANHGAYKAGGRSVGLGISLPKEPENNKYISKELNFEFHYFFTRKYWFAYMAKALVIFPGGFGTLDELAEILTLIQTKKMTKPIPILIYGSDYWKEVINFEAMVKWGTISRSDLKLFHFSDDVDEAFSFLTKELIEKYGK